MRSRHTTTSNAAYTLLELSLVLAVLSLLIAGIMGVVTQSTRRAAMMEVKRKMDVIEAELIDFRRLNGRLPCPADSSLAITSQYFGIEGTAAGNCQNGSVYTNSSDVGAGVAPDATFYDSADTFTVGGDVPIKTLGLSDDYMFDPWGGRFFYAVDNRMTAASAFTTYNVTSTSIGSITMQDGSGNNKVVATSNAGGAIAVLMSYGPDGHGAFQLSGARKSTGTANANELINCHCDGTAAAIAWPNPPVFIQAPATSTSPTDPANFDDIVRFYLRSSFLNATDVSLTR